MGNTCSTVDTPNAREDRFRRAGAAGSGKPVSSDDKPTGAYDASLRAAAPAAVNWSLAPHGSTCTVLSLSPVLLQLDDFLTADECDGLVALASPDLRRSRVTDGHVSSGRTSSSSFLTGMKAQDELVVAITRRIVETANRAQRALDDDAEPPTQPYYGAEPMQVVRYSQGQGYCLHFDNKHGSTSRKVTFMMYLNSPESDCGTHFPRAAPLGAPAGTPPGIKVMPRKGRAILFYNIRNGVEDDASLHEGMPVGPHGEKNIATLWLTFREDSGLPEESG